MLVLVPSAGHGQERSVDRTRDTLAVLTLADALAVAARENPVLVQQRNEVTRAAADRLEQVGLLLPSLDATSRFSTTHTRRFTTTDVFGDPTAREEAVESTTRGANQGLGVVMTLFDRGETITGIRAASAREDAAEAAVDAQWTETRATLATGYYDLFEARETVKVEQALLASRRDDVERTESLFRIVAADQIDVLGARIEARWQEAALAAAVETVEKGALELARAMGTGGTVDAPLIVPYEPFDPARFDPDELVETALAAHPDVERLQAELDAAEAEEDAEGWLAYLPEVRAGASYDRSEFGAQDDPFFNLDPQNSAWGFQLSLSLPVFDRFTRRAERARANVAVDNAAAALRARRLEVAAELRSRWLDLRNAWRQLEIERETTGLARQQAELAREKYQIGAIDFLRLQEVADQTTTAERGVVQRRFAWYRALVELERAVGRPLVELR